MSLFRVFVAFAVLLLVQNGVDWARFSALKEQGALEEALALIRAAKAPPSLRLAREEYNLLFRLGRYSEAQEAGAIWIRLAEESEDRGELLDALEETPRSFALKDQTEGESRLLRRAVELARTLGRADREPALLIRLAKPEAALGNYTSAAALLDQAEALGRKERDGVLGARSQEARGTLTFYQGRWQEAKYRVIIEQDEDRICVAEVPSLPGCISQGKTRGGAFNNILNNIREAIAAYLESLETHDEPVPPSIQEEIVEFKALLWQTSLSYIGAAPEDSLPSWE